MRGSERESPKHALRPSKETRTFARQSGASVRDIPDFDRRVSPRTRKAVRLRAPRNTKHGALVTRDRLEKSQGGMLLLLPSRGASGQRPKP